MSKRFYEKMFTESVKNAQKHYGSRKAFERIESGSDRSEFQGLGDAEIAFIEVRDGFYMATVNEEGQPYIQFRGGPPGFLKVLDERTLAYADFRGNLQYISVGNLSANDRAALFLMDYAHQRRLKILARVEVRGAQTEPELIAELETPGHKAKIERAMILHVEAFDWNCPQHITPRYTADEIKGAIAALNEYIAKLENEISRLREGIKLKEQCCLMSRSDSFTDGDGFQIRKAGSADIPEIAKLAVKLARQHGEYDKKRFDLSIFEPLEPRHVEYLTDQFQREDTSFLVACLHSDIVGYAFLRIEPQSFLSIDQQGVWLHDIFFEESARGRGLATRFFNVIVDEAKCLGSTFIMLGVSPKNTTAQKFFARMGFRPTMEEMRLDF